MKRYGNPRVIVTGQQTDPSAAMKVIGTRRNRSWLNKPPENRIYHFGGENVRCWQANAMFTEIRRRLFFCSQLHPRTQPHSRFTKPTEPLPAEWRGLGAS
jgi:hypothetical protein